MELLTIIALSSTIIGTVISVLIFLFGDSIISRLKGPRAQPSSTASVGAPQLSDSATIDSASQTSGAEQAASGSLALKDKFAVSIGAAGVLIALVTLLFGPGILVGQHGTPPSATSARGPKSSDTAATQSAIKSTVAGQAVTTSKFRIGLVTPPDSRYVDDTKKYLRLELKAAGLLDEQDKGEVVDAAISDVGGEMLTVPRNTWNGHVRIVAELHTGSSPSPIELVQLGSSSDGFNCNDAALKALRAAASKLVTQLKDRAGIAGQ